MNTDPKNNIEPGLKAHPEQLSNGQNAGSPYQQITEMVIGLLERGTIPWHKPWAVKLAYPCNLITRRHYRGINVFLLLSAGYESPYWLTFKQALELGGNVRKGERSCRVVFWRHHEIEDEKTGEKATIPFLRFYNVFNIEQCEGLGMAPTPPAGNSSALIRPAQIVEQMQKRPNIKHGMTSAFYSPPLDLVGIPNKSCFEDDEGYFSTLFHELVHSTGHSSRLNRPTLAETAGFGSDPYCKEELIAEMGAAFLCGRTGILGRTIENSASYVQHWLSQLRKDKTLLVQAASQAQKAADFVLGEKFEESQRAD